MKSQLTSLITVLAVSLMMTIPVYAMTPDGEPPSEETVCSEEIGALKGLCNAYCEAMDCNLNEGIHASPKACAKVLDNYLRKSGDINPPCLNDGCAATATAAANETYARCITSINRCDESRCASLAKITFRFQFYRCRSDCVFSCKPEFKSCLSNAISQKDECLLLAGMDVDAILACNTTYNEANSSCNVAYTDCTTTCNEGRSDYVPPTDSCPAP